MLTMLSDPVQYFYSHTPLLAVHQQYNGLIYALKRQTAHAAALLYAANWIRSNPQYVGAATIIAEYAAKTAMYRLLPRTYAHMCMSGMKSLGIDVESVNAGTLGEAALEMAMPIVTEYYYHPHDHASLWDLAVHTVREIIDKIKAIADMNTENDTGHAKMAGFIHANPNGSVEAFKRAAVDAYGEGAHWLALALPQIERRGEKIIERSADAIAAELKVAYAQWTSWARRSVPVLMELENEMANLISSASHGLFVANKAHGAPLAAVAPARSAEASRDSRRQVATSRDSPRQVATSSDKPRLAATSSVESQQAATSRDKLKTAAAL